MKHLESVIKIIKSLYSKDFNENKDNNINTLLDILSSFSLKLTPSEYRMACIVASVERQKIYPNQFVIMLPTTNAQNSIALNATDCINGITITADTYPISGSQGFQTGTTPKEQAIFGLMYNGVIQPNILDPLNPPLSASNQEMWSDDNGDLYVMKTATTYPVGLIMSSDGNVLRGECLQLMRG